MAGDCERIFPGFFAVRRFAAWKFETVGTLELVLINLQRWGNGPRTMVLFGNCMLSYAVVLTGWRFIKQLTVFDECTS